MLISRGITALTRLNNLNKVTLRNEIVRNSHHWYYRKAPPPNPNMIKTAEIVQGFAWWWVLWHLWTEPGHILGEFEYPDASKWTNQELGIPDS